MLKTNTAVRRLYCSRCDQSYGIDSIRTICACKSPLLVDYDYQAVSTRLDRDLLSTREPSIWRYKELLPVSNEACITTLGEGGTPLLAAKGLGEELGLEQLYLKDETANPTGSFKARGLCMAVSRAKELGIKRLIVPTAGNAGSALAAYAARANLTSKVVMPKDVPTPFLTDCIYYGAEIELVDGTIKDCGARVAEQVKSEDWFSVATLKEPYRIEGKKTMGYELAEQFGWTLPDVIIYPTGGGTGLIGMWKAFDEMRQMGWIEGPLPKMVAVQSEGCAPIPKAFVEGKESAEEWKNPTTVAAGLRVPSAIGDFLMLKAIRESGGTALAVSDDNILACTKELGAREGIFSSPEGGATLAALKKLAKDGFIEKSERVVLFITGSGYKYLDVLSADRS